MTIWGLADLHLSLTDPEKDMAFFGEPWIDYTHKIESAWRATVSENDLVLVAGDISWAKHLEQAVIDLEWIDRLPGTKLLCKGNHDYWWQSISKARRAAPPSIHLLQGDLFTWEECAIVATRLWDDPEISFDDYIIETPNPRIKHHFHPTQEEIEANEKIFERELLRLERALQLLPESAKHRIAMVHYPPIGPTLEPSRASALLEKYRIDLCLFGHLHSVRSDKKMFGTRGGVRYLFTAADAVNFTPVRLL